MTQQLIYPPKKSKQRIGTAYGKLKILEYAYSTRAADGQLIPFYECACDCGGKITLRINNIVSGNTKSCGCLRRGPRNFKTRRKEYDE